MFDDYKVGTLKEVLKNENVLDDILPADQFKKMLTTQQVQSSFTSYTLDTPLTNKARGLITMPEVFNDFSGIDYDAEPVNDVKKFVEKYGNWVVTDTMSDNTYNYCAPTEDYINYTVLTIDKPDNFEDDDIYNGLNCDSLNVVFFQCGVNLDPRGGYTKYMIALFDNDMGGNYKVAEWFNKSYQIVGGSFNYNNRAYNFGLDGSLNSDTLDIYICSDDDNNYNEYDDNVCVDTTDKDNIKDAIIETIKNSDNNDVKIDNLKIEYCCYAID